MDGQDCLLFPSRFFEALDVPTLPDGRRQIVRDDTVFFAAPDSGHEKNASPDAGAAQRSSFGGVGYAEPGCAFGFESERALGCAMAVPIGFHDRADRDVWPYVRFHHAKILTQRGERNFRPGAPIEGYRAAIRQG